MTFCFLVSKFGTLPSRQYRIHTEVSACFFLFSPDLFVSVLFVRLLSVDKMFGTAFAFLMLLSQSYRHDFVL